eukprot:795791-Pleurochrysis_carterae.AAC.6
MVPEMLASRPKPGSHTGSLKTFRVMSGAVSCKTVVLDDGVYRKMCDLERKWYWIQCASQTENRIWPRSCRTMRDAFAGGDSPVAYP